MIFNKLKNYLLKKNGKSLSNLTLFLSLSLHIILFGSLAFFAGITDFSNEKKTEKIEISIKEIPPHAPDKNNLQLKKEKKTGQDSTEEQEKAKHGIKKVSKKKKSEKEKKGYSVSFLDDTTIIELLRKNLLSVIILNSGKIYSLNSSFEILQVSSKTSIPSMTISFIPEKLKFLLAARFSNMSSLKVYISLGVVIRSQINNAVAKDISSIIIGNNGKII